MVARAAGMPWQPEMTFVNVEINKDYAGLYYLIETVDKGDSRLNISKQGIIVENDAYWWNEGEEFFKTERQDPAMGYTIKEPDETTPESRLTYKTYMDSVENAIWTCSPDLEKLIDFDSWARWVLAQDFLGNTDVAGSNMYLYNADFHPENYAETPLKMGPLWDFDACFKNTGDTWGWQHFSPMFYFPMLFASPDFVQVYKRIHKEVQGQVLPSVRKGLEDFYANQGEAFMQSVELHRQAYNGEAKNSLREQIDEYLSKLERRLTLVDSLIEVCYPDHPVGSGLGLVKEGNTARLVQRVNTLGKDCTTIPARSLQHGIYIDRFSNGSIRKWIKR